MALPSQEIQALAQAAEEERKRQEEAAKQVSAGLGLTGAAFAAQTNRAPTTAPAGPPSELAQRIAANDAANRAAASQRAANSRFIIQGGGTATGKLNPALGPQGGSTLPPQPSLSEASRAASNSARGVFSAGTKFDQTGRLRDVRLTDILRSTKNYVIPSYINDALNNPITRNSAMLLRNLPRATMVQALSLIHI